MCFSVSSHHGNCFLPLASILFYPQHDNNSKMGPHGSLCLFDYSGMPPGSSSLCRRVRLVRPDSRTAVGSPFPLYVFHLIFVRCPCTSTSPCKRLRSVRTGLSPLTLSVVERSRRGTYEYCSLGNRTTRPNSSHSPLLPCLLPGFLLFRF